jgi:arylsulfatase A-like enzyme
VVFLSDNGGVWRPGRANYADNGPLQAGKLFMHEGGSLIPFMMQWPGVIPAGTVYRRPVSAMDILPTALTVAGGTLPDDRPMDGVNLLPHVRGETRGEPHEYLAWRLGRNHALRKGDWKFVRYGANPTRLFNLAADIGEKDDLATDNQEKLKELEELYAAWESQTVAPVFQVKRPVTFSYEGEEITLDF